MFLALTRSYGMNTTFSPCILKVNEKGPVQKETRRGQLNVRFHSQSAETFTFRVKEEGPEGLFQRQLDHVGRS